MDTTNPPTRLRVRVDPIRCTAFGFCAEFCPELFDLDEWGYAWLKEGEVDGAAARLVRETARLCPRRAILVEELAAEHTGQPAPSGARHGDPHAIGEERHD
jgi:ferredoxin